MGSAQSTQATTEINKDLPQQEGPSTSSLSGHTSESTEAPQHFISSSASDEDSDDSAYDSDSDDEEYEEWNERLAIVEDSRKLRQLAEFFLYPEKPVITSDPFATGRNYFTRPSAPEYEDEDNMDQREDILEDMKQLKRYAQHYLQPERPIEVDPLASCRNYFNRPSAPGQDDGSERDQILADAQQLKKLAVDYMHPERPVVTSDPYACGRNYFTRISAPEEEDGSERDQILADAQQLKKFAIDYMHPERPVVTTDPCACGRNYFTRSSAPEQEDENERDQILADAQQLKKLAVDYLNPERSVVTSDAYACGRNYFTRPSAPEYEDEDGMDEREDILEDMKQLKIYAQHYLQPERPVEVDPLASCRNYFNRPSAPDQEDNSERDLILADAQHLKKLAIDYLHPERPVVTSDPFALGRNYFTRPSALEQEDDNKERAQIIADVQQLKKLAVDYMHPERPVVTSDPYACGRNYFTRSSAPEQEDDSERAQILAEAQQLKKLAVDYLHPERPVVTSDPFAYGRNYFTRPSAPEVEMLEDVEEKMRILEDAEQIFTYGQPVQHPYGRFVDHYYHGYYDHPDDHHSQSDHFEMDEDIDHFHEPYMVSVETKQHEPHHPAADKDHGHNNLAFSPDCVMMGFGQ
jgi:predicted Rdx family selenoprotein